MLRFLATRLSLVIPTFIGMTLLAFFLIRLVPGDPIETLAGERGIDAGAWQAAAATSLFQSLLIAGAAMIAGMLAMPSGGVRAARPLSALALAGVGLSLASSGHAATATPQWLTASTNAGRIKCFNLSA